MPVKHPRDILRTNLARAQKRQRGRNAKASTMISGRQYAVSVAGTVITFECKRRGHTYKINYDKKPISQRLSESACKRMAGWWSKERGGCIGDCPKCLKEENRGT